MKTKYTHTAVLILTVSMIATLHGNNDYGLYIKAYPSSDGDKTSLVLENNKPFKLGDETTLTFDLYVRKDNVFGVVFRAVTDRKDNIDLIFVVGENDERSPCLVIGEAIYPITQEIACETWIPVRVAFHRNKNRITIDYNNVSVSANYSFAGVHGAYFTFGLCPIANFSLYDIASINLRNIRITEGNELKRLWKMERHQGATSLDSVAAIPAITKNAQWMTDMYATWKCVFTDKIPDNAMFAYSKKNNRIYVATSEPNEIQIIDPEDGTSQTIVAKDGVWAANSSNQLFYDDINDELVTFNLNENRTARFSFANNSWNNKDAATMENSYFNNTIAYSTIDTTIVAFGGYGFYKYNNELIQLDKSGKVLKKSYLYDILPRYAAASCIVDQTLYIFGGRGNKSGRQELSPKMLFDLYAVNIKTEQVVKLWDDNTANINFLPSENMIYDSLANCFYVYTTLEGGLLIRIFADRKGFERMSYPIGERLTAQLLYTRLFFSPEKGKFYALINKVYTDKSAEVSIYSLSYPPQPIAAIVNANNINVASSSDNFWRRCLWAATLVCLIGIAVVLMRKTIRKRNLYSSDTNIKTPQLANQAPQKFLMPKVLNVTRSYYDFSKSAICLLGNFQVLDEQGRNITSQFPPKLKSFFVLFILSIIKDPQGISNRKLEQTLLPNLNEKTATNNRNVYMSRIRSIIYDGCGVEIVKRDNLYVISDISRLNCDYYEVMKLFAEAKASRNLDKERINRLIELLSRGSLLPDIEVEWLDGFKSDFSNLVIDTLMGFANHADGLSNKTKIRIADVILLHDYANDEALWLKCYTLYHSGKKGLAKTTYDNFIKTYALTLDVDYPHSFKDVVSGTVDAS